MSPLVLNRVCLALSLIGVFIAGVLTVTHFQGTLVPCGPGGGCDAVTQHPTGFWFGVPVSIFGLAAYLSLAALAVGRNLGGQSLWSRLSITGLALSGAGTLLSLFLQYQALVVVRQFCLWCIASALVMVLLTLFHAMLWQATTPETTQTRGDTLFAGVGVIVALGAIGVQSALVSGTKSEATVVQATDLTLEDILPVEAKTKGPKSAKVTVVEFADYNCPACRASQPVVAELVQQYQGKLRVAFRHFPLINLPGHQTSPFAAAVADFAAQDGNFWDVHDALMAEQNTEAIKTPEGILRIARMAGGVTESEFDAALDQPDGPSASVESDTLMALELGIQSTPSFIILAEGQPPRMVPGVDALRAALEKAPYAGLLR